MKNSKCWVAGVTLALGLSTAHAHISYGELGILSVIGATASVTKGSFSRFGWVMGADDNLGDSHHVGSATGYFRFTLTEPSTVQIGVEAVADSMDPAFSVYAGQLPRGSHDQDERDLIQPLDQYFMFKASDTDMRPDDPQISRFIPAGFNPDGSPMVDANGVFDLVENPAWNEPDPTLGGLTPAEWYAANYTPHNGYRDTLNYTTVGGLRLDPDFGWVPGNFEPENGPYSGFGGQFDPFGDWSMSNTEGEWSKVAFISSVSNTPCAGPNCESTTTGGIVNPGHFTGNTGTKETLTLRLPAGDFMIAADGESCRADVLVSECAQGLFETATVTVEIVQPPKQQPQCRRHGHHRNKGHGSLKGRVSRQHECRKFGHEDEEHPQSDDDHGDDDFHSGKAREASSSKRWR